MALKWFEAIARHPEAGTDCKLCERGRAAYCGDCLVAELERYRAVLREAGDPIAGEPSIYRPGG